MMPRITATTRTGDPVDFDPNESPNADALIQWCEDNLPFLGSGVARRVYAIDEERVFKVNRLDDARHWAGDNETEYRLWEQVKDNARLRPYFAAILDADESGRRRWLVMERLSLTFDIDSEDEIPQAVHALTRDMHNENVGRRANGHPALVDYAYNKWRHEDV